MNNTVVIGSGGHAKVVIDILRDCGCFSLAGCISQARPGELTNGVAVLGGDDLLPGLRGRGVTHAIVALGDNGLRLRIMADAAALGFQIATAVSPHAVLSPSVTIGAGTVVMPGAVINADTRLGEAVIINTGATVDHDCDIGDGCHIAPGTNLAGCVHVGTGAFLGTGSRVIPRMHIGRWAVVGAGAVVISDIPDECVSVGVPARVVKSTVNNAR
jgi:UDP-perosamine 4-acetyltransferase